MMISKDPRLSPSPPGLLSNLFTSSFKSRKASRAVLFACALLPLLLLSPVNGSCQSSGQDLATTFRAGQTALRQGDFSHAVEDFKKVLALDPSIVEAEVNLGLAYQSLLDYDAAARTLSHALRTRPNLPGVNVIVGMDYIKLGSPEKAAPYLRHALQLDPSSIDARDAIALYNLTQDNMQGAAEQYRKIADLTPDKPAALYKLGHQYIDLAARLAYQGARLYPDSSWGHRFLGDMLFERARWPDAGKEYGKALAIEPGQSGLHTLLGEALLHDGKLDDAEAEFRRELQIDPRYEQALLGLANVQLARGNVPDALASVTTIWKDSPEFLKAHPDFPSFVLAKPLVQSSIATLSAQPDTPSRHFLLAALYAAENESADSDREAQAFQSDLAKLQHSASQAHYGPNPCKLHLYSQCIASLQNAKPQTASGYLLLGKSYFMLHEYSRAAEALAKVRGDKNANSEASYWLERSYQASAADSYAQLETTYPDSWRTHELRAEDFALRQNREDAVREYRAALELRPDEAELHEALGEFYLDNRSDRDAERELEKAVALDPSRTKTLYLLGRLYVLDDQNEKAVPFLRRAVQLQPNLNEASGLLGTAYVRMGQFADAVPMLEKAAPLDHFGNIHYQLYQAYRKLGQTELAKKALARSQEIRRSSLEHDQAVVMGSPQTEPDSQ